MSDTIRKTKPTVNRQPDPGRMYIREVRRRKLAERQPDPQDWHTYGNAIGEDDNG